MLQPAPTSKIDPKLARGVLAELGPVVTGRHESCVLEFANTNYRLHLVPTTEIRTPIGKRIIGTINASVRRIDIVKTGGRFIDPIYGSPRRIQGSIVEVTETAIVVNAGVPIHCVPTERGQTASDFEPGQFVSFGVLPGVTFTPVQ